MKPRFRFQAVSRLTGAGVAAQPAPLGCPAWGFFSCGTLAGARGGEG